MRSSEICWNSKIWNQFADTVLCSVCRVHFDDNVLCSVEFTDAVLCSVCWCCAVLGLLILCYIWFADTVLCSVCWHCAVISLLILHFVRFADTMLSSICWYCTALGLLILRCARFADTLLCSVVDGTLEGWLEFFGYNIQIYLWCGVLTVILRHVLLHEERTEYSQDLLYSFDGRLCGNPECSWEEKYLFPLPGIET